MRISRFLLAALPASVALVLLGGATALAASPATGSVRIEGLNQTLLAPTSVTTNAAPVVNDGNPTHSCEGTSDIGALQVATGGNWLGEWSESKSFGNQYFINAIEGEAHTYTAKALSYYWSFWLNDVEASAGPCQLPFEAGDRVLFFPKCDEACPAGAEGIAPLEIETPAAANVGEAVNLAVKQYNAKGEASPSTNANVTWSGGSATTDSQGHATAIFARAGVVELRVAGSASGPPTVRTEASICVHNENDGTCGSQSPAQLSSSQKAPVGEAKAFISAPYRGPYAVVSRITDLIDGHVYDSRHAPRLLTGKVVAHSGVASVSLELHRSYRGRCYAFDGVVAEFRRARCGHGSFFVVSHTPSFSYLLPAALAPGRYVLDSEASDVVGNHTTLARGTTRIVFYVR
jgi:hypothetical protein